MYVILIKTCRDETWSRVEAMFIMTDSAEKRRTICRGCGHGGCGVYVTVENGRAIHIAGDRQYPISKGYCCKKAHAAVEMQYHPILG